MTRITEAEFAAICNGITADREKIIKYNPIGTSDETLLWMLLSVLVSYLSLDNTDTPCFTGKPDAQTFREAIDYVLLNRRTGNFEQGPYIEKMIM